MIAASVKAVREMSAAEAQAWAALSRADPAYANPFLGPDFARCVGAVRDDAMVALFHKGGVLVGAWPFHRRPGRLMRPIGAPFSDWHGPVLAEDAAFDPLAALAAMDMASARFTALADPFGHFHALAAPAPIPAQVIDLEGGATAHRAWQKAAHSALQKNLSRCARKAERDHGAITFTLGPATAEDLATLIAWKRAQYVATGRHDVLGSPWAQRLLTTCAGEQGPHFAGLMASLRLGGQLAAAEFYLCAGAYAHAWITAYDRAFATVSPGYLLLERAIPALAALGVTRLDMGQGQARYKLDWANATAPSFEGTLHANSAAGKARRAAATMWEGLASAGLEPVSALGPRVRRRFDQICAVELDAAGRVRGIAQAVAAAMAGKAG